MLDNLLSRLGMAQTARRLGGAGATAEATWPYAFPISDGVALISDPRAFAHDEGAYDAQYANDADRPEVGRGAAALARDMGGDLDGPALEVGAGTGLLSVGLVAGGVYPSVVLTDPSPRFVEITRRKIARARLDGPAVRYAVLRAEDLGRLPAGALSLVVLRSVLHHVLDVERFVAEAARSLRPGGILTFQEPCAEGNVLMGALAPFVPMVLEQEGRPLSPRHQAQLQLFIDTMRFYARRDVDKAAAEDKHLFRPDELMQLGRRFGLEVEFLPNTVFEDCVHGVPPRRRPASFVTFFRDYLRYCMSFDTELVDAFAECFAPHCAMVEELSQTGDGPAMHGVFVCRRRR